MVNLWNYLSGIGTSSIDDSYLRRNVTLSNRIGILCSVTILTVFIILSLLYGIRPITPFIAGAALVPIAGMMFTRARFFDAGRFFISISISLITITLTVGSKLTYKPFTEIQYFEPRIYMLSASILPLLVFQTTERVMLYAAMAVNFLMLMCIDPIHNLMGVGFYQSGLSNPFYPYLNYVALISYLILNGSVLTLRTMVERSERENQQLLQVHVVTNEKLKGANQSLRELNQEVEAQNEEIIAQHEELATNQEVIAAQKNALESYTNQLEQLIEEKSNNLIKTNQELMKYNNELRQFSYTVSHNLRAPVARILGLTQLLHATPADDRIKELTVMVQASAREFDDIIKDLNKIIDIRNEIYNVREKVYFEHEWKKVFEMLLPKVEPEMVIQHDFSRAPFVYTVRPILNSILYNLISNALKYRSLSRPLHISVTTVIENDMVKLSVKDNGLGLNLEHYGTNLFQLYKRFHTHTDGKGVGLYLVKSQIEALNGKIEVESELNTGSTFHVYFKTPSEIEGQVCFSSDYGKIFYNARTNVAGIVWLKPVTSQEYRTLFTKCGEMVRLYRTPYWLSDVRRQGLIDPEDQKWMVTSILPDAIRDGLEVIVGIYDPTQHNDDYRLRIQQVGKMYGVGIEFFTTRQEAESFIESRATHQSAGGK